MFEYNFAWMHAAQTLLINCNNSENIHRGDYSLYKWCLLFLNGENLTSPISLSVVQKSCGKVPPFYRNVPSLGCCGTLY